MLNDQPGPFFRIFLEERRPALPRLDWIMARDGPSGRTLIMAHDGDGRRRGREPVNDRRALVATKYLRQTSD